MSILHENQRRALTYVQAANHGGCSPTPQEVSEWVEHPDIKRGKVTRRTVKTPGLSMPDLIGPTLISTSLLAETAKTMEEVNKRMMETILPAVSQIGALASIWERERVIEEREPDETLIEQLERFQWVRTSATGAGLVLTELGRALLRSDAEQYAESDVKVLDGQDPLAWGALVGTIAAIGECVIVDPYIKPDQFLDIAKFTGTTRVILRRPRSATELVPWRVYQALPEVSVDIRVIDPQHIHDRYIVGETAVYGLGCSLDGVGRKPTTLVPMTGMAGDRIRSVVEEWCDMAEPMGEPPTVTKHAEAEQIGNKRPTRKKNQSRKSKAEAGDNEANPPIGD